MRLHRHWHILLPAILLLVTSGCSCFDDVRYPLVKKMHTHRAWAGADLEGSADFERGWKEGYYKVSTGHDGRLPVVPHKRYWATKYQNIEGQQAIQDWYAGYQAGALAAEQEGNREWHPLPAVRPDPSLLDPFSDPHIPLIDYHPEIIGAGQPESTALPELGRPS